MNDNEQCVRKENNTPGKILYFMCWAIVALSAVTGIMALMVLIEGGLVRGAVLLTVSLAAFIVCFVMKDRWLLEYDYGYYDGKLSIAKVYNQKSRKEFMQISLEEIEYIAPVYDEQYKRLSAAPDVKTYKAYLNDPDQCYFIFLSGLARRGSFCGSLKSSCLNALKAIKAVW